MQPNKYVSIIHVKLRLCLVAVYCTPVWLLCRNAWTSSVWIQSVEPSEHCHVKTQADVVCRSGACGRMVRIWRDWLLTATVWI